MGVSEIYRKLFGDPLEEMGHQAVGADNGLVLMVFKLGTLWRSGSIRSAMSGSARKSTGLITCPITTRTWPITPLGNTPRTSCKFKYILIFLRSSEIDGNMWDQKTFQEFM